MLSRLILRIKVKHVGIMDKPIIFWYCLYIKKVSVHSLIPIDIESMLFLWIKNNVCCNNELNMLIDIVCFNS